MKPTKIELCSASYHAGRINEDAHAAYWLEATNGPDTAKHLRQDMWKSLEKLAKLFGAELVEIEPEADEPEPVDPETIAAREENYRAQMIDAGRGGQLK